jgi:hypothetical protein
MNVPPLAKAAFEHSASRHAARSSQGKRAIHNSKQGKRDEFRGEMGKRSAQSAPLRVIE